MGDLAQQWLGRCEQDTNPSPDVGDNGSDGSLAKVKLRASIKRIPGNNFAQMKQLK